MENKAKQYVVLGVRNMTFMEAYSLTDSYQHKLPGTECIIKKSLYFGEGFPSKLCHHIGDRKRLRQLFEEEIRKGMYGEKFFSVLDKTYKDALKKIKVSFNTDLSKLTNDQLISYFDIYYDIYITTFHPMVLAIYASDLKDIFEEELKKTINSNDKLKILELMSLLLTPTRLTTVQKEEQLLFEVRESYEKEKKYNTYEDFIEFTKREDIKDKLSELEERYGSFHMEYIGESWKVEDYTNHIWKVIEENQKDSIEWKDQISPEGRLKHIIEEQQKFYSSYNCSKFFKDLVYAMQEYLIVLDYTKADVIEGLYRSRPYLNELAKRIGLNSWIDVRYFTPNEIKDYLKNNLTADIDIINERKKNYAIFLDEDRFETYSGKEAVKLADELIHKDELPEKKELKGLPTYPGKVTGKVIVVTNASERDKFVKGSILVTRDTTTELTSIIKKSIGIVADQGSLLSHTGIVSREFKIPCIVQTNLATKLFKDGDIVEVDADNGVVRKIDN